jgi:uncharacterized caspase-like protein
MGTFDRVHVMGCIRHMLVMLGAALTVLGSVAGSQVTAAGRTNVGSFPVDEVQFRGDSASVQLQRLVYTRARTGKNWLLTIGISKYIYQQDWKSLTNPVNDAKTLRDLLLAKYRFETKRVRELYDKEATREAIFDAFTSLKNEVKPEDNVLVYFAGHGKYDSEIGEGYWIPADGKLANSANYIKDEDIRPFLAAMKARSVLILSDVCFSASMFRGPAVRSTYDNPNRYFEQASSRLARQVMTSGGNEPVMDGGLPVPHSVFAYFLLEALKKNSSPYLVTTDLFQSIRAEVANHSKQFPELLPLPGTYGHLGGEFIFFRK